MYMVNNNEKATISNDCETVKNIIVATSQSLKHFYFLGYHSINLFLFLGPDSFNINFFLFFQLLYIYMSLLPFFISLVYAMHQLVPQCVC